MSAPPHQSGARPHPGQRHTCNGISRRGPSGLYSGGMRILAVDPGLTRCGLGVVDATAARQVSFVDVTVIRSAKEMAPHLRLKVIADGMEAFLRRHRPDVVAVERVFAESNVRSVMSTAQVAGVAMLLAAQAGLPLGLHSPSEVKAAVTGDGRADKKAVQFMVQRILRLEAPPKPADAADSLALAITHAWRGGALSQTATSSQHGGAGMLPRATGADLTSAQAMWAQAERDAQRSGAAAASAGASQARRAGS